MYFYDRCYYVCIILHTLLTGDGCTPNKADFSASLQNLLDVWWRQQATTEQLDVNYATQNKILMSFQSFLNVFKKIKLQKHFFYLIWVSLSFIVQLNGIMLLMYNNIFCLQKWLYLWVSVYKIMCVTVNTSTLFTVINQILINVIMLNSYWYSFFYWGKHWLGLISGYLCAC